MQNERDKSTQMRLREKVSFQVSWIFKAVFVTNNGKFKEIFDSYKLPFAFVR